MRDFMLDRDTHDLVLTERDLTFVTDPQAIAQNIKQRLLMFTDEWFLNLSEGTPWIEQILVKGQRQFVVEDILKARIRGTPGVADITSFEVTQAGERGINVAFTVTTTGGGEIDETVGIAL